jgi:hypothetical protein
MLTAVEVQARHNRRINPPTARREHPIAGGLRAADHAAFPRDEAPPACDLHALRIQ